MQLPTWRKKSSIDDKFQSYVIKALIDAEANEEDEERIEQIAAESVEPFADQMGRHVADQVMKDRKSFRINSKIDEGFNKRLRSRYHKAFKGYTITAACALEAGEMQAAKPYASLSNEEKATRYALIGLHAKGCRVAGEVYALLINGFPEGALARCRTLHEMAVVAGALADCAGDPAHGDLAIRYLDHAVIDARRSALQYQKDHSALGMEPLEQEYIDDLEDHCNAAIAKYGRDFAREYGWAKNYCPDDNLGGIERRVRMGHMRSYYKLASNEVHAGSRGISLNKSDYRGEEVWQAGKRNTGLTQPASMALNSLYQLTVMLLVKGVPNGMDLTNLVTLQALHELRTRTEELFLEAVEQIDAAEQEVRRSLNL
ncbi:DUF5677 domain-containing protein [Streptomyces sp. NRRL B-3648]|uniref:DUF5677 domain-containing protein n=1 Tax=Streptomyces sp. NRRL B-3648 TaxID=1519493 RepID=UPI000A7E8334|nr:DUF5677 domain-containing protein [Streptomyces sp. NRRL B-3648]